MNAALVPAALRLLKKLGPGWHFLPATAARNARGAFHCGAQAGLNAGSAAGNSISNNGATLAAPGLLRQAAEGKFKVLFLHRADELVTHPQHDLIRRAIEATPTVIAIDFFPSWLNERAAVVLPGASFCETNGSMTDLDGTLQRMGQACRPAGEAQEDWRIIESLAGLLGAERVHHSADEIFTELQKAWGVTRRFHLDDLNRLGPGAESPQVSHPYLAHKTRPAFKLAPGARPDSDQVRLTSPSDPPPDGGQIALLWIHHAQGPDHLTSHSTEYDALRPRPVIELHPADAARLGLADGDWVSLDGGADVPSQVRLTHLVVPGAAFGAANVLGLRLAAAVEGLPAIKLTPTAAPASEVRNEVTR